MITTYSSPNLDANFQVTVDLLAGIVQLLSPPPGRDSPVNTSEFLNPTLGVLPIHGDLSRAFDMTGIFLFKFDFCDPEITWFHCNLFGFFFAFSWLFLLSPPLYFFLHSNISLKEFFDLLLIYSYIFLTDKITH